MHFAVQSRLHPLWIRASGFVPLDQSPQVARSAARDTISDVARQERAGHQHPRAQRAAAHWLPGGAVVVVGQDRASRYIERSIFTESYIIYNGWIIELCK